MKFINLWALAVALMLNLSNTEYVGMSEEGLPIFTIDLNKPQRERFKEVSSYYGKLEYGSYENYH